MNEGRKSFIRSGDKSRIYNHDERQLDATENTQQRETEKKHPFAVAPKKRGLNQRSQHYTQQTQRPE